MEARVFDKNRWAFSWRFFASSLSFHVFAILCIFMTSIVSVLYAEARDTTSLVWFLLIIGTPLGLMSVTVIFSTILVRRRLWLNEIIFLILTIIYAINIFAVVHVTQDLAEKAGWNLKYVMKKNEFSSCKLKAEETTSKPHIAVCEEWPGSVDTFIVYDDSGMIKLPRSNRSLEWFKQAETINFRTGSCWDTQAYEIQNNFYVVSHFTETEGMCDETYLAKLKSEK